MNIEKQIKKLKGEIRMIYKFKKANIENKDGKSIIYLDKTIDGVNHSLENGTIEIKNNQAVIKSKKVEYGFFLPLKLFDNFDLNKVEEKYLYERKKYIFFGRKVKDFKKEGWFRYKNADLKRKYNYNFK